MIQYQGTKYTIKDYSLKEFRNRMSKKDPTVLNLNLKKKWFDMIASGEKKEEYRDIKKHWTNQFIIPFTENFITPDRVRFMNGMSKNAPIYECEFIGIRIDYGVTEWGAEVGKLYYVISLGEKI